jgi:uncharacterized protein (TIGR04255 family)
MGTDPQYGLLLGRFSAKIESEYTYHEALNEAQIPDAMIPYMAQHRFRKAQNAWPVIQLGPGVMTLNDTDGYEWGNFKPRCEKAVSSLFDAYPKQGSLKIESLTLRYIDAADADFANVNIFSFLKEKMKTTIHLPDELFADEKIKKVPVIFNMETSFSHSDIGLITLRVGLGQRSSKQALIWETIVQAKQDLLPELPGKISDWLEKAHNLTDDWFFKLIEGDLEKEFSGDAK